MAAYTRVTSEVVPPAVVGGGTYARRLPNSIAFGVWFPKYPYPGHDTDEHVSVNDLQKGVEILIQALVDVACAAPLDGLPGPGR